MCVDLGEPIACCANVTAVGYTGNDRMEQNGDGCQGDTYSGSYHSYKSLFNILLEFISE